MLDGAGWVGYIGGMSDKPNIIEPELMSIFTLQGRLYATDAATLGVLAALAGKPRTEQRDAFGAVLWAGRVSGRIACLGDAP